MDSVCGTEAPLMDWFFLRLAGTRETTTPSSPFRVKSAHCIQYFFRINFLSRTVIGTCRCVVASTGFRDCVIPFDYEHCNLSCPDGFSHNAEKNSVTTPSRVKLSRAWRNRAASDMVTT